MSDNERLVLIAFIAALPGLATAFMQFFNNRAQRQQARVVESKVDEVHHATNSMKDALVKATGDAKLLEGIQQGADAEKARQAQKSVARAEGAAEEKARQEKPSP